ncbi:hypothetical protein Glove_718g14 [Diversispora epigaea]|uniref:Uncharacterized protein n=1 Tax=Diversispora epigaea TaxID=1348612 RepID=A0A397G0R5_9GLOM|nr:hypothetical protein Glove_718g14 [Diversispora epigaea]
MSQDTQEIKELINSTKRAFSAFQELLKNSESKSNETSETSEPKSKAIKLTHEQSPDDHVSSQTLYLPNNRENFMKRLATFSISFVSLN